MSEMEGGTGHVVRWRYLGLRAYDSIHELQLELVERRYREEIADTLLLLQHEPVMTLGRRGDESHILVGEGSLRARGIAVRRVERGGDVTYHGPGQIVGYPILRLADYDLGASDYMHRLEQVVIDVCAEYGLVCHRREKVIGVWVGENKIAALGVRIRRGITFHGWAFNVAPNMDHWAMIVPCGITDGGVTSLAQELEHTPAIDVVVRQLVRHFGRLFDAEMAES